MHTELWLEIQKARTRLGDLDVDGIIILKLMLNMWREINRSIESRGDLL